MSTNVFFPSYFANLAFETVYYNNSSYDGLFLYTTDDGEKVYCNLASTNGNTAIRIRWSTNFESDGYNHIANEYHGFSLQFNKDILRNIKDQEMKLIDVVDNKVVLEGFADRRRIEVPILPNQHAVFGSDYPSAPFNMFEKQFFSATNEEWEARKLNMERPLFNFEQLKKFDLKRHGFDKPLKNECKYRNLFGLSIFGLKGMGQQNNDATIQKSEGLHGIDFPELPKEISWYKDLSIQVVLMPMQRTTETYFEE